MLYDKLKAYAESGVYPFHMPGHKRQRLDDTLPYEIDLTEIHGFDYLHDPQGCIRAVEHKAEALYHVNRAFLLINGTTGGIFSAVRAMTNPDDKVIIARNCHKSVYNAVELCGLNPVYYTPDSVDGTDIYGSVYPEMLDILLSKHTDAKLVVITSPTYEGVCSDIEAIAKICHHHGAKLLVDEAHGAHFPFSDSFPQSAIQSGADVTVTSLHKTLPAPTQTALLFTNDKDLERKLQQQLAIFETSSPSYILMSGIEKCLDFVKDNSFEEYISRLNDFYQKAAALKKLRLFFDPENDNRSNIYDYDLGKLVIITYHCDITGRQLADILREKYFIETEMSSAHYVIAMTSVCDTKEGFDRLFAALQEIDNNVNYSEKELNLSHIAFTPEKRFNPSQGYRYQAKTVDFASAQGETSLEYVYAYPPGIPLLVPGEVISEEIISSVNALIADGVDITSTNKTVPQTIAVADW